MPIIRILILLQYTFQYQVKGILLKESEYLVPPTFRQMLSIDIGRLEHCRLNHQERRLWGRADINPTLR
jgi:hypothetical protein